MAPASRRGFLGTLAALSGAAAPVALAAATRSTVEQTHPDAELLAAGAAYSAAMAEQARAEAVMSEASRQVREALGWCPPELRFDRDDDVLLELWRDVAKASGRYLQLPWDYFEEDGPETWVNRLDGAVLRAFLHWLPIVWGRAGRTPMLIRRLRGLLRTAEARDAADEHWRAHFGQAKADKVWRAAREAVSKADDAVLALPATTLDGIALKARHAQAWAADHAAKGVYRMQLPACVESLLASALALPAGEA